MKKIFYQLMAVAIAACTFTACEDVPEPYNNPLDNQKETEPAVEVEPAGSGTAADPWNVTALQKACEGLAAGDFLNGGTEVYTKGVVVEATEISTQYGNATYYIADASNAATRFYVFRGKLLESASVTSETDLEVGDTVVVCGKVKNYNGTLEFDQGNYLTYFAKGKGGSTPSQPVDETTIGTATEPITVAKALELINALEDGGESKEYAFVKGKVVSVQSFNDQYKSITYYISDDGTANGQIQCYSGKNVGGADFTSKDDIQVGQEVIVKGKLKKYVAKSGDVTPELNQGNELVNAGGSGNNDTPAGDAITVAKALELINGYADGGTSETEMTVKGKIVSVVSYNSTYKSITYYISDDGTEANQLQIYSGKGLNGADFAAKEDLTVGKVVTVKGTLKKYVKDGNVTPEMDKNSVILSIEDEGAPAPSQDFITVAKALELINGYADGGSSETEITVKGKIVSVQSYSDQYKSITYYISDDGTENNKLQIYSGKGLNGADFAAKEDLTVGKVVTVKGKLKKYVKNGNVTPEMDKNSVILSIEDESTPSGDTPSADFITVAKALELINGYADGGTSETEMTVKGKIVSVVSYNSTYKSITYYISDDGTATNQLQIYSGKGLNGADFAAKEDLTVGKVVKVKGTLKKYVKDGNVTPEMDKNSTIISIE